MFVNVNKSKGGFIMENSHESDSFTVYMHISPSHKYYVGITKLRPQERWGSQGQMYKKQGFWHAIQKYGWDNFKHVIIAENLTKK